MTTREIKKPFLMIDRQVTLSNFLRIRTMSKVFRTFTPEKFEQYKAYIKQKKERKKAKRKRIISIASFALNILILSIVLIVSFSKEGFKDTLFPPIDIKFLLITIALTASIFIIDAVKIFMFILSSTKKARPFLSFKTTVLGRYYDAITPSAIGGQPFQMLYMNKRGIDGAVATSIPLMKTMFWQIANVLTCSFVLIFGTANNYGSAITPAMQVIAWVALSIQVAGILGIFILSVSKRIGPKIVIWVLKLLSKMHIVKNYRATFRNVMRFVANYQKTFKAYAKSPWLIISQFILAFGEIFVTNMIPYFIYKTFVPDGTLIWSQVLMQSITCNLSLMFIPTPGGSGGAEGFFVAIFSTAFGSSIFWPLLFWRFSNYYSVLLLGLIILIYDFAIGNKKLEKKLAETKEEVQEEQTLKKLEMSFTNRLKEQLEKDKRDIKIVRAQERDKILLQAFNDDLYEEDNKSDPELIKNSEIVSEEEMEQIINPAEKVLDEISEKQKLRRSKKRQKQIARKNKNKAKKSK